MGIEYTKMILVHYFKLAGVVSASDNEAEIRGAVEALYESAVSEAKRQILKELNQDKQESP